MSGSNDDANESELQSPPLNETNDDFKNFIDEGNGGEALEIDLQTVESEVRSSLDSDIQLSPPQQLVTNQKVLQTSLWVLRFTVFTGAITGAILQPNYPLMASVGAHPESFPSTSPFDFNAATYFIPMSGLLALAIASTATGIISDRVGRKPCIIACMFGSAAGTAVKYFLRRSFWGFCGANFFNGMFSASVPVALAYVGDVFPKRQDKDSEIGVMIGLCMLGTSGGGICAILMESQGLFAPLWLGVGISILGGLLTVFLLIEPSKEYKVVGGSEEDEEENEGAPEKLNKCLLTNILAGALGDNIGSSGLLPLCLSPLAFQTYYSDLISNGQAAVMSQSAYKWISVLVALMVIPSAAMSPPLFNKIGVAATCVMGNVITAVITVALLYIGLKAPPTGAWFGIFVAILYVGFPFTVFSQLTTGPMLDFIAPADKRGFVQGLNVTVMNFGGAVSPFVLGLLADGAGTQVAILTCVGISIIAAIINLPLCFVKGLGPTAKKISPAFRPLKGEDEELVKKALAGEWIPAADLDAINEVRCKSGQPYLVTRYGDYHSEKDKLKELRKRALEDYHYYLEMNAKYLRDVDKNRREGELDGVIEKINNSYNRVDSYQEKEIYQEMGQWFADYLKDNGYKAHTSQALKKQMIMTAFPTITHDKDLTTENVETIILRDERLLRQYIDIEDQKQSGEYDVSTILKSSQHAIWGSNRGL